jgi:hypothetical protein
MVLLSKPFEVVVFKAKRSGCVASYLQELSFGRPSL